MKTFTLAVLCTVLCACHAAAPSAATSAATSAEPQPARAAAAARPGNSGAAFDYYLLNLSWAPEFCFSKPGNPECSGHFGFIVHGLWPQYQRGGYPEDCASAPGLANPQQMLDLMPDLHLISHEWSKHGTCTGLSADEYFGLIRRIYGSIRIPKDFVNTPRQLTMSPAQIKQEFESANPGLSDGSLAISCGSGPYFVGLEICVSKDGKPIPCGAGIRDCNRPSIRIPRVQ